MVKKEKKKNGENVILLWPFLNSYFMHCFFYYVQVQICYLLMLPTDLGSWFGRYYILCKKKQNIYNIYLFNLVNIIKYISFLYK